MALPISPPLPPCDPVQSNAEAGPSLRRAFSHPAYDGDTREDRRSGKVLFCDNNRSGDENGSESNSCQRLPKASKALRASSISTCPERNRRPASLRFSFHPAHPGPPVFYPGQEIPAVLHLALAHSLPLSRRPKLDLLLLGTLQVAGESRVVACARATLGAALSLWVETGPGCPGGIDLLDANILASTRRATTASPMKRTLEGGRYDLALRAMVPATAHLPPSHTLPNSAFSLTYALRAELSCVYDNGARAVIGAAELPFELLPATLPRPPPPIPPHSVWITTPPPPPNPLSPATKASKSRTARWVLHPRLPSSVLSPTEQIPIVLRVLRPDAPRHAVEHVVIVRASLIREERARASPSRARVTPISTVVSSTTMSAECTSSTEVTLCLPLMEGASWGHGYTVSTGYGAMRASSTFQVRLNVLIAPRYVIAALEEGQSHDDILDSAHSSSWTQGAAMRTFTLPVEIGSVGEPRGAEYAHSWTEIEWCADGTGHLISGSAITSENGWVLPPPPYGEALRAAPYVVC